MLEAVAAAHTAYLVEVMEASAVAVVAAPTDHKAD